MYKIKPIQKGIRIEELKNFNAKHIFECGQAFRWDKTQSGSYIVVAYNKVIEIYHDGDDIIILNTTQEDFINIWHHYFDLDKDYDFIKEELSKVPAYHINESLKEAMRFGYGIRVLNQDSFEMIISFIISANNQIPRIKNAIRILSETYGDFIGEYKGKKYYQFPTPSQLANADPEEVKEIARVGFRNYRIVNAAKAFLNNPELYNNNLSDEILGNNLLELEGIGPKVRDCILLFGYDRIQTFPVDVWVKRLMEFLYIKKKISNNQILQYGIDLFGDYRGYAQQYLFYYARENKIGK